MVRAEVARQGYGLDILVNDKDSTVLSAVIKQGYNLDNFVTYKESWVRQAVAE